MQEQPYLLELPLEKLIINMIKRGQMVKKLELLLVKEKLLPLLMMDGGKLCKTGLHVHLNVEEELKLFIEDAILPCLSTESPVKEKLS